jgi:hypothetical protein
VECEDLSYTLQVRTHKAQELTLQHRDVWDLQAQLEDKCRLLLLSTLYPLLRNSKTITSPSSTLWTSRRPKLSAIELLVDLRVHLVSVDHTLLQCHHMFQQSVHSMNLPQFQARKLYEIPHKPHVLTQNRHLLRKSGTFTSLDFAPPKKFKDPDSMSDAGSIRSNRSGVSAMQLGAIRKGAYRVSRLPQDMVPTKDDMTASLKPQWGMRAGS